APRDTSCDALSPRSIAAAKTAIEQADAMNAIAVPQCNTTDAGELANFTVAAPNNTCARKRAAIAMVVGAMNGDRSRLRHAAHSSEKPSGVIEKASSRCAHSKSVPSPKAGNKRP